VILSVCVSLFLFAPFCDCAFLILSVIPSISARPLISLLPSIFYSLVLFCPL
jgi:hypothetical protein